MAVAPGLAWRHLMLHRRLAFLLVLGIAVAATVPVIAAATGESVARLTLAAAIADLSPADRSIVVSYGGTANPSNAAVDDVLVRTQLARLTDASARRQLLFGPLADTRGTTFRLAAVDDIDSAITLTSGRMPAVCTPTLCEVVRLGAGALPQLDPALTLSVVGTAERRDPLLLSGTFTLESGTPLLLANGVVGAAGLRALALFPRGSGWVAGLDPDLVALLGVPAYVAEAGRVADVLNLRAQAFVLTAPTSALARESGRAETSAERFTLLGAACALLVLGVVAVGAVGLRPDHTALRHALAARGASRSTMTATTIVASMILAIAGTIMGIVLGLMAIAAMSLARRSDITSPAQAVSSATMAFALVLVASMVVCTVSLLWQPADTPRERRGTWRIVTVTGLALAVVAWLVLAGPARTQVSSDPRLVILPTLILLAGALVAVRLWAWTMRVVQRVVPRRAGHLRLAATSLDRHPLRAAVTTAFLVSVVGLTSFSGTYRQTLSDSAYDTAAYSVPGSARVTSTSSSINPVDVAAASIDPGAWSSVLRTVVSIRTDEVGAVAATTLGIDPRVLVDLPRWDRVTGGMAPDRMAALLTSPVVSRGVPVPQGVSDLRLPLGDTERTQLENLTMVAWFESADGRERAADVRESGDDLQVAVPTDIGQVRLTAFTLREAPTGAGVRLHRNNEGSSVGDNIAGELALGAPRSATWTSAAWDDSWAGPSTRLVDGRLRVSYRLDGPQVVITPGVGTQRPIDVVTDPDTAALADGGVLRLGVGIANGVAARVVGVLPRFPTAAARFVIADRQSLAIALDTLTPGTGAAREIWVDDTDIDAQSAPWDQLVVESRQRDEAASLADPVAQGGVTLLTVVSLICLTLGLITVLLLVRGERDDHRGEWLAAEAGGATPASLRRLLGWRTALVLVPASALGVLLGGVLAAAVTATVAVSAIGTAPLTPLVVSYGGDASRWLAAFTVVGLLVAGAVVASSFRAAWPGGERS